MTQQTTAERIEGIIWRQARTRGLIAEIDLSLRRVKEDHNDTLRRLESAQAQLFEARDEVERLRPAAEAWRTLEDFREAKRTGTLSDEKRTRKIHETARDAARAARRSA